MVQRSGYLVSQIAQDFEFRVKLLQPTVSPTLVTQHILDWTAGQPFLTYRLYELILQGPLSPKGKHSLEPEQSAFDAEGIWIDTYVRTNLIKYCSDPELIKHLRDICRIMIQDPRSLEMLRLYRRLRRGRTFPADLLDHVQRRLVQSGLAKLEDQELQLSNRFYGEVFNGSWLARAFKTVEARLRDEAVAAINAVFEEQRSPLETQQIPCLPQPQWREQGTVTEATSRDRPLLTPSSLALPPRSRPPAEAAPAAPRSALWLALALVACAIGAATTLLSVNLNRDADGAPFQAPSLLQLRALFGDGEG